MHPPQYRRVRADEAAKHLGLSPSTLAKFRHYGSGPRYSKLGKAVVYALEDLDAWAESRARHSTSEAA